jgi:hypothetical protein
MAKVEMTKKMVEVETEVITVEMTKKEASALKTITGSIGGTSIVRKVADSIWHSLNRLDIEQEHGVKVTSSMYLTDID